VQGRRGQNSTIPEDHYLVFSPKDQRWGYLDPLFMEALSSPLPRFGSSELLRINAEGKRTVFLNFSPQSCSKHGRTSGLLPGLCNTTRILTHSSEATGKKKPS
jgi:hypothetical protein